jgi:glycosyltransferase involved in cell wall biosynthesis
MDISIIIPTFNRSSLLRRALESLALSIPSSEAVEILVIDNGSTDKTADIFHEIRQAFTRHNWHYFYEGVPGLLAARHRGYQESSGSILTYLDDDVLLAADWFTGLKDAFSDPIAALVGGPSRPRYESDPPAWLDALWWKFEGERALSALSLIDLGTNKKLIDPCFVLGLNYSIRRNVLKECGGFNPDLFPKALQRYQGDGETGLSLKLKAKGHQGLYHPDVAVTHLIPASRLAPKALERRGFYQGVCDSYTRIRAEGGMSAAPARSWKDPFRPLKRKLYRAPFLMRCEAKAIRDLIGLAHTRGMAFHQNEVRNDRILLEWVLRPDYFDFELPKGWQRYANLPQPG